MSGGIDGGTVSHVVELAEILAAANPQPRLGQDYKLPVIYAGNKDAKDKIKDTLGEKVDLDLVDNIRPVLEQRTWNHLEIKYMIFSWSTLCNRRQDIRN